MAAGHEDGAQRAPAVSNNDVINADPNQPSEIVEFPTNGEFIKQVSVDIAGGASFGLATRVIEFNQAQLAAVDDNQNILINLDAADYLGG